jgi:hypothetical protein
MRRALWIAISCPTLTQASELATDVADDDAGDGMNWYAVGRPGLDPGTLGLKVGVLSSTQYGRAHRPSSSQLGIPAVTSE